MLIHRHVQIFAVVEQTLVQKSVHVFDEWLLESQAAIAVYTTLVDHREKELYREFREFKKNSLSTL